MGKCEGAKEVTWVGDLGMVKLIERKVLGRVFGIHRERAEKTKLLLFLIVCEKGVLVFKQGVT